MSNALIRRLRRFTGLGEQDLAWLESACATTQTFHAYTDILRRDEPVEHLAVVLDGWAARTKTLSDGRQQHPALALPGEVCNLDVLLMDRLDFSVVALTPCLVASVPRVQLRAMLDESPALRDAFWWMTLWENSVAGEWTVSLGRRSAVERVAHLFCELQVRLAAGATVEVGSYPLPVTQQTLGDALGLSAVHINRSLQVLRRENLIRLEGRQLTILDWNRLKVLADFRPGYLHLEGVRRRAAA